MEEKEIWKDVIGYEGLYQVSNLGRIKSLPKEKKTPTTTFMTKETILNQHKDKGGYFRVMLTKKGKSILKSVHVIVASAFIGERGNLTVNHKLRRYFCRKIQICLSRNKTKRLERLWK